jgi:hypothetical protein
MNKFIAMYVFIIVLAAMSGMATDKKSATQWRSKNLLYLSFLQRGFFK